MSNQYQIDEYTTTIPVNIIQLNFNMRDLHFCKELHFDILQSSQQWNPSTKSSQIQPMFSVVEYF